MKKSIASCALALSCLGGLLFAAGPAMAYCAQWNPYWPALEFGVGGSGCGGLSAQGKGGTSKVCQHCSWENFVHVKLISGSYATATGVDSNDELIPACIAYDYAADGAWIMGGGAPACNGAQGVFLQVY